MSRSSAGTEPKLLDQVRAHIRMKHLSRRTELAYVGWIRRFVIFHDLRHPADLDTADVQRFLSHLAVDENVAASTQNQALAALLFLYRHVLRQDLDDLSDTVRAKSAHRLPMVLTPQEARAVLAEMRGASRLIASLLYGSGLRLLEALRLRVKDLDFTRHEITVRSGKGAKDRRVMMPSTLLDALREQLRRARLLHDSDLREGYGAVHLPYALERKYPNAAKEWRWQYVFPARQRSREWKSATRESLVPEIGP